jgi:hypothetical protein
MVERLDRGDPPNGPLGVRVQIRGPREKTDWFEATAVEHGPKRLAVLVVSIHDDESLFSKETIERISQVAANLHHQGGAEIVLEAVP